MPDRLSTLQNSHNRRLALKVAIFSDTDVCLFVLLFGLFELDLVDFDAVFRVREVGVDGEGIVLVDFFAFGVFCKGPEFGAGERLEGAFYFGFGWEESVGYSSACEKV